MARKSPPWPSTSALFKVVSMGLSLAPIAGLHRVAELILGKRVRAWNGLCRLADGHPDSYRYWRTNIAPQRVIDWIAGEAPAADVAVIQLKDAPKYTLEELLAAQARQGKSWLLPVMPGDRIDALVSQVISAARDRDPYADIFFWDEDQLTQSGPVAPWIKPAWDPLLHAARDCLTGASALSIEVARQTTARLPGLPVSAAGFAELQLAMIADGARVAHVPLVLTARRNLAIRAPHWPALVNRYWPAWRLEARSDQLPFWRALPPDPTFWPSVSIIIPIRDRADLLRTCLSGLARLAYPGPVEIIIVDNGSSDPETLALLTAMQTAGEAHVLRDDGNFNFARLNNRAAVVANGTLLCLLNNDVEALDGDWLSAMVRHAVRPDVGAVGAQLLYSDGTIQHAGVSIGTGNAAGHIQRGVDPASLHHAAWHAVTRQVSAVTAACLLVSKANFDRVGGMDEAGFAVAFNDVDFCLKLQAVGLTNVYCVESRLLHAESRTRAKDSRPDQAERFAGELALLQSRWRTDTYQDPHHSQLFSRSSETCLLLPV